MGIFLHRLSFERREYQHRDLIPGLLLVSFEPSIQLFRVVPRQRTGKVHNATRQRGDVQRREEQRIQQKSQEDDDPRRLSPDAAHAEERHHAARAKT
jgi:hypothetical protein